MKSQSFAHFLLITILLSCFACQGDQVASAPVVVDEEGNITLYGEAVTLENLQASLLDTLLAMPQVPDSLAIAFADEILMGVRGEVRTAVDGAIAMAQATPPITRVVHDFYEWYDSFQRDESRNLNFTGDDGEHLILDSVKLSQYYANLRASGFISREFVAKDSAMLKRCEALWQNESKDEVPSCLDADRFFCAQDWALDFWIQAPVLLEALDNDRAVVTLSGDEGGGPREQQLTLVKENDQWMISGIDCDLGVE